MKSLCRLAPLVAALFLFTGGAKTPDFTVRFYMEALSRDSDHFANPIQLQYPPRAAYISKVPFISEHMIRGIYIFTAADGSFGCLFQLDEDGRLSLQGASVEHRNGSVVAFVGNKKSTHQVIDMIIDKEITDGVITIQRGLTLAEANELRKSYHPIVPKKK